jgi:hypothetical protein
MTASTSVLRKRFNGPMQALGGFFKMCVLTAKALARPFQWKEFTSPRSARPTCRAPVRHWPQ